MNSYSYLPAPTFLEEPNPTASDEPTAATTPLGPVAEATRPVDPETAPLQRPPAEGAPLPRQVAAATRHQRKCSVCRHPDRYAIEEAFLHWQSPNEIATQYDLSDEASIYRHAHATGLFARRDCNLRFALGNFIERVNEIQIVTPGTIVRAVRAYTRISKTGEWVEPPRHIIVTHARMSEAPLVSHVPSEVGGHAPSVPSEVEGHVQAAEVPACDPDITQITAPKALPPRLKRLGNGGGGRGA